MEAEKIPLEEFKSAESSPVFNRPDSINKPLEEEQLLQQGARDSSSSDDSSLEKKDQSPLSSNSPNNGTEPFVTDTEGTTAVSVKSNLSLSIEEAPGEQNNDDLFGGDNPDILLRLETVKGRPQGVLSVKGSSGVLEVETKGATMSFSEDHQSETAKDNLTVL